MKTNYAYIDGSYNPKTKVYGYGGFLVDALGIEHILQGHGDCPDMAKMRNVAGELMGARAAVDKAIELNLSELTIYHDYIGVSHWVTGAWKATKSQTKAYAAYILASCAKAGLSITFKHVPGHCGLPGNELADKLAKEAVGLS